MRKLSKKTFKGIEYIRLSSLPAAQAESLKKCLDNRSLIKIMRNDAIIPDCVLYSVYEAWFDSLIFEKPAEPVFDFSREHQTSLSPQ